jgi:hypothetical protein
MKSLLKQFPRLSDLYKRSDGSDPDNYFNAFPLPLDKLWPPFFQ